ncbi:MAG TPA: hypothetical protein VN610_05630, partial [Bryobacteraceae bacterium]|nr:hypothetical protein [Bryobacteraceae bacterium]
ALMRAVGHVLDRMDANENGPCPGLSVDVAYAKWKANRDEHRIFWEFIEEERNNILKKYTFGFVSGDIPILAGGEVHVLNENYAIA